MLSRVFAVFREMMSLGSTLPGRFFQMYLNMLFLTPLFIDTGCPSSSSTPASPPSPARPAIFCRSSSSSCAIVFLPVVVLLFSLFSLADLACEGEDFERSSFFSPVEVELKRMRLKVRAVLSWRKEAVRMGSMLFDGWQIGESDVWNLLSGLKDMSFTLCTAPCHRSPWHHL